MPEVQQMLSHFISTPKLISSTKFTVLTSTLQKKNMPSKQVQAKQRMQSPLKYKQQQQHLHLQQTHCKKYYGKKLKPLICLQFYLIRLINIRSNGMNTNYTTTSSKALLLRMFSYNFFNEKNPYC
jgi:hypothetical protein